MALGPRLDLRQGQQLVMTPQLQQAIKLLALNHLELNHYVAEEMERNPLLEAPEGDEPERPGEAEAGDDGDPSDYGEDFEPNERPLASDQALERDPVGAGGSADSPLDADFGENVFNSDGPADRRIEESALEGADLSFNGVGAVSGGGGYDDLDGIEDSLSEQGSLRDHLLAQLQLASSDPATRLIGGHLIDLIDEAGYLHEPFDEVPGRLGCSIAEVEEVLALVQSFEPTGVAARDLAECLRLQCAERDRLDPAMAALLDHLPLLARQDFPALRRLCGVDQEDLADMIAEIQSLNPKPGLAFGGDTAQTLVPDIYVRKGPAGSWLVELNSAALPKVLVNQRYYAELSSHSGDKATRGFISECLNSANWLIKALDQRARTILKVSTELVRQQEEFFEHGVRYLKPLTLRHVAEAIAMHESTVSRVTSNKYMATPRGIFELKYFFTTAIAAADTGAESHSSESVRDHIRTLIDQESPDAILSDDALVDALRVAGIDIARRTVAKYREGMRIASSVQRRRLKRLNP